MRKYPHPARTYLAPRQVAEMLMVSPATVRHWASKGTLGSVATPGGHRRFMQHEVERFARENDLTLQPPTDGTFRVLVVDDDQQVSRYLTRFLDQLDTDISSMTAHDGYTAGRLVQTFRPHVVLLDLMMPGLNGFDVCAQIKNDTSLKATRVITMTGFYDNDNVQRALDAGAECCIEKPFDQNQLKSLLGIGSSRMAAAFGEKD